jgi:hypothetical protein
VHTIDSWKNRAFSLSIPGASEYISPEHSCFLDAPLLVKMRLVLVLLLSFALTSGTIALAWNRSMLPYVEHWKALAKMTQQIPSFYMIVLEAHPLRTKCFTGLVLFAMADVAAQMFTSNCALHVRRVAFFALWGAAVGAPLFHLWYPFLAWLFGNQLSYSMWFGALLMSLVDQFLFMPLFVSLYYLYRSLTTGSTCVDAYVKVIEIIQHMIECQWQRGFFVVRFTDVLRVSCWVHMV